jgi:asparagine synthase (glutamine-hydrolysing)
LEVTPHDMRVWSHWAPDPDRTIRMSSDDAYAETFREHFDEAVRCRLRSKRPVGAYLSGGLDSSSIAVTARDLRAKTDGSALPTFSTIYDRFPSCDERPYIHAVLDQGGFEPHYILGDDVNASRGLEALLPVHDVPFFAPNLAMNWRNASRVRAAGVSVLLDGHGGDEVVSQGYGRFHELAQQRAWTALAREAWGASDRLGGSAFRLWGLYAWRYGVGPWMDRRPWAQRLYGWYAQGKRWLPGGGGASTPVDGDPLRLLSPELRAAGDVEARYREALNHQKTTIGTERSRHHAELTAPIIGQSLELLDRTARAQGVEARFPFLDRRLLSFCLALPAEQKRKRGWGRYVLRSALRDRLPRRVHRRRDKTDFTPHFVAALQRREADAPLADSGCGQNRYIDDSVLRDFRASVEDVGPKVSPQILFSLWRAIVVSRWVQGGDGERSTNALSTTSGSESHCQEFESIL